MACMKSVNILRCSSPLQLHNLQVPKSKSVHGYKNNTPLSPSRAFLGTIGPSPPPYFPFLPSLLILQPLHQREFQLQSPLSPSLWACPCDTARRQSSLRIDSLWYLKLREPGCQDTQHRRHSWGPGTQQLLPNNKGKKWEALGGRCSPNLALKPKLVTLSQLFPDCLPSETTKDRVQLWDEGGGRGYLLKATYNSQ